MWPVIWVALLLLIGCPKKNKAEEFVPRTFEGLEDLDEDEFPEDSGLIDEPLED